MLSFQQWNPKIQRTGKLFCNYTEHNDMINISVSTRWKESRVIQERDDKQSN